MEKYHALRLIEDRLVLLKGDKNIEQRERLLAIAGNIKRGWAIRQDALECLTIPDLPHSSMQSWRETLYATQADGTAITAAAETIMVPNFTIPGNYLYPGRCLKYTILGKISTVITTPGTITAKLKWGGVGGTQLVTSGAYAPDPTAASTDLTCIFEFWLMCREIGTSAASLAFGRMNLSDFDDASATTLKNNLDMNMIPTSSPATVNIDTTTANALSPTFTQTVATGSFTAMLAILESLS